jgi:hypothetical protein
MQLRRIRKAEGAVLQNAMTKSEIERALTLATPQQLGVALKQNTRAS